MTPRQFLTATAGDTLFLMGCGRLFEGTPPQMWSSLSKIAALPPQTWVFCAHEYTQANAKWAQAVNPHNQRLAQRAKQVADLRSKVSQLASQDDSSCLHHATRSSAGAVVHFDQAC